MKLPEVKISNGVGGLGRAPAGSDHISGLIHYMATLPSGFDTDDRTKKVNSLAAAVAYGINFDFADADAGVGGYAVTAIGDDGDTIEFTHTNVKGEVISLCIVKKTSSETTIALLGTKIVAGINAGFNTTGYLATDNGDGTFAIVSPKFNGVFSGDLVATVVGTIAGDITQFDNGTISPIAALYYHISEFFRKIPNGELYVSLQEEYGAAFEEVKNIADFAEGKIRQVGIMNDLSTNFATTQISKIQAQCDLNFTNKRPMVALFAPEITSTDDLNDLPDLSGLNSDKVATIISQDMGGVGGWLALSLGKSLSDLGAKLGVLASSKVSDSWAWVAQYNMTDGIELNTIGFSNGVSYATADSLGLLNQLTTYAYSFLRKITDYVGTYNNQPNTATLESSDYRFLYSNRTIQKAGRLERFAMTPFQSSPVILNADGTLTDLSIETFKNAIGQQLDVMVRDGELSNYLVTIDPAQNILQDNTVSISVKLQPVGVADFIDITNTYTLSIAA